MTGPVKCRCFSCGKYCKYKYCSQECHLSAGGPCTDIGGCPECERWALWKSQERDWKSRNIPNNWVSY